jgi:AcrR family transcriptional regulator
MNADNSETGQPHRERRAERKPRADGVASRRAILEAAANLATTRGLEGLSIGELARHIGMSKSGLYAHFQSKEELELATIETAAEVFERDVLARASASPGGLERVRALSEAFLGHLERRVYPGGCFFATVAAQLASSPGRARDRVLALQSLWVEQFVRALEQARSEGELASDTDIEQLVFEITAMMILANFAWTVSGDPRVLEQARTGIRHVVERVVGQTRGAGRSRARSRARAAAARPQGRPAPK